MQLFHCFPFFQMKTRAGLRKPFLVFFLHSLAARRGLFERDRETREIVVVGDTQKVPRPSFYKEKRIEERGGERGRKGAAKDAPTLSLLRLPPPLCDSLSLFCFYSKELD